VKQTPAEKTLYKWLGGIYAIAAVVDHFQRRRLEEPYRPPKV